MRVDRISPATQRGALEYLARAPYDNVLLSCLILFDRSQSTRNVLLVASEGARIAGVAYFGRQLVLAADDDALEGFARRMRRHGGERTISGPRATVAKFWGMVAPWHARPRLIRDRQLVMAIDRTRLQPYAATVVARAARTAEWPAVADASATMISGELEYDPRRSSPDFSANVRSAIERERWWVGERDGRLAFFCNVGPWCRHTAQLQGVWTPPELRGQGLATAALGGICDHLLTVSPTLSLHVNDFNAPAIALYRRVGFDPVSEYQTLMF